MFLLFVSLVSESKFSHFRVALITRWPSMYDRNVLSLLLWSWFLKAFKFCMVYTCRKLTDYFFMERAGSDAPSTVAPLAQWRNDFSRAFQYYLDRSTPHTLERWLGTLAAAAIYVLRVYYVRGFYIVSYGLGIYILNLLIGFMSPKVDPELEVLDGASLPTKDSDEFKPFVRRLPEFKFW